MPKICAKKAISTNIANRESNQVRHATRSRERFIEADLETCKKHHMSVGLSEDVETYEIKQKTSS